MIPVCPPKPSQAPPPASRPPSCGYTTAILGNRRFLSAAVQAGYDVELLALDHPDAEKWRRARAARIGREQNASWVAGRYTACRNLADNPPSGVKVMRGHPDELVAHLATLIM